MNGPTTGGATDPHESMRNAQDRRFEREGIPMLLGLFDERAADRELPAATEPALLAQGARYADLAGDYARSLFPQARDADLASSIVVLQALSYRHFGPTPQQDVPLEDPTAGTRGDA